MEIKTCEEYVLEELKNSKEEINSLKRKLEEQKKENEKLKKDITDEIEKRNDIDNFILLLKEQANPKLENNSIVPYIYMNNYISSLENRELFNLLIKYFNLEEERNEELDGK